MIYIFICIFLNAILFVIFKLFSRFKINTLQAIVFNYIVAGTLALSQADTNYGISDFSKQKWFYAAILLGFLFISIFNIMAKTTQLLGVSVAAITGKMSMIIPVFFGYILYNENFGVIKITAVILAILAVYLTSIKEKREVELKLFYYPFLLFIGSGLLDTLLKYFETNYVKQNEVNVFIGTVFFIAFFIGVITLLYYRIQGKLSLSYKNIFAGVVLGIVNYYSMYYLLKALQTIGLTDSSKVFTLNNIGIVLFSSLIGYFLFEEKYTGKNKIGIVLSIISILLLTLST